MWNILTDFSLRKQRALIPKFQKREGNIMDPHQPKLCYSTG